MKTKLTYGQALVLLVAVSHCQDWQPYLTRDSGQKDNTYPLDLNADDTLQFKFSTTTENFGKAEAGEKRHKYVL